MLGERHPIPHRVVGNRIASGVFSIVANQVTLESLGRPSQSDETGLQVVGGITQASKRQIGPETSKRLLPGPFVESFVQLVPAGYSNVFQCLPLRTWVQCGCKLVRHDSVCN